MDSSDVEFSSPIRPARQNWSVGKASRDLIITNAGDDLCTSKKISKTLQDNNGNPGILLMRVLSSQRFETFRKEFLQVEYGPSNVSLPLLRPFGSLLPYNLQSR